MLRWVVYELNQERWPDPGPWRGNLVATLVCLTLGLGYFWLIGDLP